jgi:hypothetical protein
LEETAERCCQDPQVERLNLQSDGPWQRDWHPDQLVKQQAHLAIRCWPGRPLILLLRLRFGPLRRLVLWVRRKQETAKRTGRKPAGASSESDAVVGNTTHE